MLASTFAAMGCGEDPAPEGMLGPSTGKSDVALAGGPITFLVHGYLPKFAEKQDCLAAFKGVLPPLLQASEGPVFTVGYYSASEHCDISLANGATYTKDGDRWLERGDGGDWLSQETPIEHLAYRLAWAIAKTRVAYGGVPVRVVAHSLGGVIMRWVMLQAAWGNRNFPTPAQLGIEGIATAGTPHGGVAHSWVANVWGTDKAFHGYHARQALEDSPLMATLKGNPQTGGATWLAMTSVFGTPGPPGDGFISNVSACWDQADCVRFRDPGYWHNDFFTDANGTEIREAAIEFLRPEGWTGAVPGPGAPGVVVEWLTGAATPDPSDAFAACTSCISGGGGTGCKQRCGGDECLACIDHQGGTGCLPVCISDACTGCLAGGGGAGCAARCPADELGSDCNDCVAAKGGTGCIPRCEL